MAVLFFTNSQVELLGFIFRHCAVASRWPKIIAGQNEMSTVLLFSYVMILCFLVHIVDIIIVYGLFLYCLPLLNLCP